ncbi:subtilase family protein [Actinidia rufa]|uniref:Subtilase family protein n=1 Tax=Actinidia rufa TaxID=165716 RepID=A0A7J0FIY1_9ERIC|nr:subtilase family protein [Actinidia rufa]
MRSNWFCFIAFLLPCVTVAAKQTYIVHMNHHHKPLSYATQHDWYSEHLQSLTSDPSSDSLLYTYTTAFHGFAASLSPDEAESLRRSDAVLDVYEDTIYSLHTTRTPEFLGLDPQLGLWAMEKEWGKKPVGLVYTKGSSSSSNLCLPGSLEPELVRGKLVLCDRGINARVEKGAVVRDAGGVGMILANTAANGEELVADSHLLPAVAVGRKVGDVIREYVRSDGNPTAVLSFGGNGSEREAVAGCGGVQFSGAQYGNAPDTEARCDWARG